MIFFYKIFNKMIQSLFIVNKHDGLMVYNKCLFNFNMNSNEHIKLASSIYCSSIISKLLSQNIQIPMNFKLILKILKQYAYN